MTQLGKNIRFLAMTAILCTGLAGAARAQDAAATDEISDPYIGMNRAIFNFNDAADQAVLRPIAKGYRTVVPRPARNGVRNVLRNLRAPVNFANELMQGDLEGAGVVLTRTVINTLIGLGGLIDIAADEGIPYNQEDFGQTMAVWGVGHGPYMVIPLMGPSSLRDSTGLLVDGLMDPLNWYLRNTHEEEWIFARLAVTGLVKREDLLEALDDLRRNSLDYYVAMRSAYVQNRAAEVRNEGVHGSSTDHP